MHTERLRLLLWSILFLCLLEEGLAHGWLLSDVVGSHYTNATKQTQTVELVRLIIVLVSLHVATSYLDSNFYFFIWFRAFIELQDGIKLGKSCPGKKNCDKFARATVTKSFQMTSGNTSSQASGKPPRYQTYTVRK